MLVGHGKKSAPAQNGGFGTNNNNTGHWPEQKRSKTATMADYVPTTDGLMRPWLKSLKTNVPTLVTQLEITPARLTNITGWCDSLLTAMDAADQAKTAWLSASQTKQTQMDTSLTGLRGEVAKWKVADGMTDAIAAELQIVGGSTPFNPETYQAQITAQAFSGYVRIKGKTVWKFVSRDTNSPYDDHTPLAVAGQSEVREYQAFGLWGDDQIGQPSDIVSVTFAG
jgi:hypothetical protein